MSDAVRIISERKPGEEIVTTIDRVQLMKRGSSVKRSVGDCRHSARVDVIGETSAWEYVISKKQYDRLMSEMLGEGSR